MARGSTVSTSDFMTSEAQLAAAQSEALALRYARVGIAARIEAERGILRQDSSIPRLSALFMNV